MPRAQPLSAAPPSPDIGENEAREEGSNGQTAAEQAPVVSQPAPVPTPALEPELDALGSEVACRAVRRS